jgi:hypothetical protein
MTPAEKHEFLGAIDPNMWTAAGFDDALVGYVDVANKAVALYDRDKCLAILTDDGKNETEAIEYFEYNVASGSDGSTMPAFATFFPDRREKSFVAGSEPPPAKLIAPAPLWVKERVKQAVAIALAGGEQ